MKGKMYKMFVVKRIEDVFLKTKKKRKEKRKESIVTFTYRTKESLNIFFCFQMKRSQSARPSSKKRTGKKTRKFC